MSKCCSSGSTTPYVGSFALIPLVIVLSFTGIGASFGSAANKDLSDGVIELMPKIQAACEKYNISEYAPLVAAVMMQESGGNVEWVKGDVMQCAESMGYPAGTPVPVDDSIDHGTGLIANLLSQVGWGGLADAFDPRKENWQSEYNELKELLTDEEYRSARGSVNNAHYTSPTIIRAIYAAVEHMGFENGRILEPAMGVGNFFGMLPENMRDSELFGVELAKHCI